MLKNMVHNGTAKMGFLDQVKCILIKTHSYIYRRMVSNYMKEDMKVIMSFRYISLTSINYVAKLWHLSIVQ